MHFAPGWLNMGAVPMEELRWVRDLVEAGSPPFSIGTLDLRNNAVPSGRPNLLYRYPSDTI